MTKNTTFMDTWKQNDSSDSKTYPFFLRPLSPYNGPSKALQKTGSLHNDFIGGLITYKDYLLTSSEDRSIKIWNKNSLEIVHEIEVGTSINYLALSPDGYHFAAACDDYTVKIYELESWDLIYELEGHEGYVSKIAFTQNGTLVSGSKDGNAGVWDLSKGGEPILLEGHEEWIFAVAAHPTENQVLIGAMNSSLKLWDLNTNECLKDIIGGSRLVYVMGMTIGGNNSSDIGNVKSLQTACWISEDLVCTVADDIVVWNAKTWEVIWQSPELSKSIKGLVYDAKRELIITGSATIDGWDAKTGKQVFSQLGHDGKEIYSSHLSDGILYTGDAKGNLKTWEVEELVKEGNNTVHSWGVSRIMVDEKNERILSGSFDETCIVWDKEGKAVKKISGFNSNTKFSGTLPNNPNAALIVTDGKITVVDLVSLETIQTINFDNDLFEPEYIYWLNDEMFIASTLSYRPRLVNITTGAVSVLETPCSFTENCKLDDDRILFCTYVGDPIDIDAFDEDDEDDDEEEEEKIKAELMSIGMPSDPEKYEKNSPLVVFNTKTMKVEQELWLDFKLEKEDSNLYPSIVLRVDGDEVYVRYTGSHIFKWNLKTKKATEVFIYETDKYGMGFYLEGDNVHFADGKSLMMYQLNLKTQKLALWEAPGLKKRNYITSPDCKYQFYTVAKELFVAETEKKEIIFRETLDFEIDELHATENKLIAGTKGGEIIVFQY